MKDKFIRKYMGLAKVIANDIKREGINQPFLAYDIEDGRPA